MVQQMFIYQVVGGGIHFEGESDSDIGIIDGSWKRWGLNRPWRMYTILSARMSWSNGGMRWLMDKALDTLPYDLMHHFPGVVPRGFPVSSVLRDPWCGAPSHQSSNKRKNRAFGKLLRHSSKIQDRVRSPVLMALAKFMFSAWFRARSVNILYIGPILWWF